MTLLNPLGFHVANIEAPHRDTIISHMRQAKHVTATFLDDAPLAVRVALEVPSMKYPVYRKSGAELEPVLVRSDIDRQYLIGQAREFYQKLKANRPHPNVLVNVNCEQTLTDNHMIFYVELMNFCYNDPDPVGMVLCNNSAGTMPNGFWIEGESDGHNYVASENWWTRPEAMEYLQTIHMYRNKRLPSGAYCIVHGSHYYTSMHPAIAVNGGEYQQNAFAWAYNSKVDIDWSKPQDHLGRDYQAQMMALGWRWGGAAWRHTKTNAPYAPNTLITESNIDDMADVWGTLQVTLDPPYQRAQGWQSMKSQWERWYKELGTAGSILFQMRAWEWETIYAPAGIFLGAQYFTLGNTGGDRFRSHNISPGGKLNEDYADQDLRYRVEYPDAHMGGSEVPMEEKYIIKVSGTVVEYLNHRATPSSLATIIGNIPLNTKVKVAQANVGGWAQVEWAGRLGWVSLQPEEGKPNRVQLVDKLPGTPTDPTPQPDVAAKITLLNEYREKRDLAMKGSMALQALALQKTSEAATFTLEAENWQVKIYDLTDEIIGDIIPGND